MKTAHASVTSKEKGFSGGAKLGGMKHDWASIRSSKAFEDAEGDVTSNSKHRSVHQIAKKKPK